MKPVLQARGGATGDCYRACLATVLERPLEDVPDFVNECGCPPVHNHEETCDWHWTLRCWMRSRWLDVFYFPVQGNAHDEPGFGIPWSERFGQHWVPPGVSIAHVEPARGSLGHVVVCYDGQLVHDPMGVLTRGVREPELLKGWDVFVSLRADWPAFAAMPEDYRQDFKFPRRDRAA